MVMGDDVAPGLLERQPSGGGPFGAGWVRGGEGVGEGVGVTGRGDPLVAYLVEGSDTDRGGRVRIEHRAHGVECVGHGVNVLVVWDAAGLIDEDLDTDGAQCVILSVAGLERLGHRDATDKRAIVEARVVGRRRRRREGVAGVMVRRVRRAHHRRLGRSWGGRRQRGRVGRARKLGRE